MEALELLLLGDAGLKRPRYSLQVFDDEEAKPEVKDMGNCWDLDRRPPWDRAT